MFEWSGGKPDERWKLEVETDCFDLEEGMVVSVFMEQGGYETLAALSAEEAREVATALVKCADHIDHA